MCSEAEWREEERRRCKDEERTRKDGILVRKGGKKRSRDGGWSSRVRKAKRIIRKDILRFYRRQTLPRRSKDETVRTGKGGEVEEMKGRLTKEGKWEGWQPAMVCKAWNKSGCKWP